MSIIKIKKRENPYVQIDKNIFEDPEMSWRAKGLLSYLLSKPDNWVIRVTDIIKKSTDGRDSVYAGLRELRKNGYLLKAPVRNEQGKITEWIEELYEEPNEEAKKIYEKQQSSRKKSKEKKIDSDNEEKNNTNEVSVDKIVDIPVDNIDTKPLTENTEMDILAPKPLTDLPYMDKPNMDKPYTENPEILIIKNSSNIDSNNIDNRNKEKEGSELSSIPSTLIEKFYTLMKNEMSDVSFKTWIEPLIIHITNQKAIIETKDKFNYDIVVKRYLDLIKKIFKHIGINKIDIKEKID